jgi:hypothetical protein
MTAIVNLGQHEDRFNVIYMGHHRLGSCSWTAHDCDRTLGTVNSLDHLPPGPKIIRIMYLPRTAHDKDRCDNGEAEYLAGQSAFHLLTMIRRGLSIQSFARCNRRGTKVED